MPAFQGFFGGLLSITADQFQAVNGYANHFWGWGREDDNLKERLLHAGECCDACMPSLCLMGCVDATGTRLFHIAGMWPPEYPPVPRDAANKAAYFLHHEHKQAEEVCREFSTDPQVAPALFGGRSLLLGGLGI